MISDPVAHSELRTAWEGVKILRDRIQRSALAGFATAGLPQPFLADVSYNPPFIHAFAVLNDVLLQLRDEGHFGCKTIFLGGLVDASASVLPWLDLGLIKQGIDKRNDVAHRGVMLPRKECWKYIDTIYAQLVAWRVLP